MDSEVSKFSASVNLAKNRAQNLEKKS